MRSEVTVSLAPELRCPRCERPQLGILPRSGDLWLRCLNDRCRASLWVIVVPAGATGRDLAELLGTFTGARAIIRRAHPRLAPLADCLIDETPLTSSPEHGAYILIAAPGHVHRAHGHSSGESVLRTLGIL